MRLEWLRVSATALGRVSSAVVTRGRSARFVPSPLTGFDFVLWACSSALVRLGLCPLDGDVGVASGSARDCFALVFATLLVFFKAVEDMANRQINIFNLDMKWCFVQTIVNKDANEHPPIHQLSFFIRTANRIS